MPRLLVSPGSQHTWEISLKPGTNTLGRNATNDFQIEHPSVSGSHCQIVVGGNGVTIRDLGSTNGTYLNHALVQESVLQSGQTLQLGSIEMLFEDEVRPAVAASNAAAPAVSVRPAASHVETAVAPPTAVSVAREPAAAPLPPAPSLAVSAPSHGAPVTAAATDRHYCKYHPKTPARLMCPRCAKYYCDLCAINRQVSGKPWWFCRTCSAQCTTLEVDSPIAGA